MCVLGRERQELRRPEQLSLRQPLQASTGWKVAAVRWNLRYRQLPGPHREKVTRRRSSWCPFKTAGDYLPQCNGTMGLHQPVVRGRACLQGGGCAFTWGFYCHFFFLPLLATSSSIRHVMATQHIWTLLTCLMSNIFVEWMKKSKISFKTRESRHFVSFLFKLKTNAERAKWLSLEFLLA